MNAATPAAATGRYLRPVPDTTAGHDDAGAGWATTRPALVRVCAGEPLLLTDADIHLVDLVNSAADLHDRLLPDAADPDEYRLAEVMVEFLCTRYGVQRHGKGDRLKSVVSEHRRYLIPFLVELAATRPAGRCGVAALTIRHLETLPRMLAGDLPLPAATVAGDRLGRRAVGCIFLGLPDAAAVTAGGRTALDRAVADETVPVHADARTGEPIVRAADLRGAGLLLESATPHGLAKSTATNVLRDLRLAVERARDLGAGVRGRFTLTAIEPLPGNRLRPPKPAAEYVSLTQIAANAAHLRVIGQVVLWIARVTGERISEVFGLYLSDYFRDEHGRPWLAVSKQGGRSSLGRNPENGRFERQDSKNHTKTEAGERTIPIPRQLAALLDELIRIFHTDAETGKVNWSARLIPGVQSEDTSGQSTFRTWLKQAQNVTSDIFDPHDLRAALITDLKNAGVEERLAHYYAGHEKPNATIQDLHYDLGPYSELLHPIADLLETKISAELGTDDLRAPTALTETWGRKTRRHRQRDWIEEQLLRSGWRSSEETVPGLGRLLDSRQVAARIGRTKVQARKLMDSGAIVAHKRPWGTRDVWVAYEADVGRYLDTVARPTLSDLAAQVGWNYHQLWHLVRELDLVPPHHRHGSALRLSEEAAGAVRAEVARRDSAAEALLSIGEAAAELDMEVGNVETLIRSGHLLMAPGPTDVRRRQVTRASVDDYQRRFPASYTETADGPPVLLPGTEARRLMGVTRFELSQLEATRQIHTSGKPGSRHKYVVADSAVAWAERLGRTSIADALRRRIDRAGDPGSIHSST